MDRNLVFSKTPAGEEATLQRTRVVQRNLRMVLLQVDGQLNVSGLVEKIGNEALVFNALSELEKGGYIALSTNPASVWEQGKQKVKAIGTATAQISPFSAFEPSKALPLDESIASAPSQFSTFGAPVSTSESPLRELLAPSPTDKPSFAERVSGWLAKMRPAPRDLKPYRRVSWGKRIGIGIIAILLMGFLTLLLFPYDNYRPSIQAALSQALGVPVKVGSVNVQLYPRPALVLRDIQLSEEGAAKIGTIFISQLFSPLDSDKKIIKEAVLSDVTLSADFASRLLRMLDGVRSNPSFGLEHLRLKNVSVTAGGVALSQMDGEIAFKPEGSVSGMSLQTASRSLQLQLSPGPSGTAISIEGYGWKPSEHSPYVFGAIAAKGLLQQGKLVLPQAEIGLADGSFQGGWWFDWSQGFSMAGDGVVAHAKLKRLAAMFSVPIGIEGDVSGDLRIRGSAPHWQAMWGATEANMNVQMERVVINGVDFGTATRRGVGQSVRGGMSKFDRVKGKLRIAAGRMTGTDMELIAGLVRAQGEFVARADKTVEALFNVKLESSVQPIRASLRVSGSLPTLEIVAVQ